MKHPGNTFFQIPASLCTAILAVVLLATANPVVAVDYFVNDNSTNRDVWTTAVGNDANPGTNAAAPKLTLTNLLATVSLLPGDTVYIDSGIYSNYTVTVTNGGSAANPIRFCGSTNLAGGGSIFIRNNVSADVWFLNRASNVVLCDLTMRLGREGVSLNQSLGVRLERLLVGNNSRYAVYVNGASHNVSINNLIMYANDDYDVHVQSSTNCSVENSVLWGNRGLWSRSGSDTTWVSNNVLRASGLGNYIFRRESVIRSDNNLCVIEDSAAMATVDGIALQSIPRLSDWQQAYSNDWQSTTLDPLFANANATNFYPLSQFGRWNGTTFTNDAVTSPLIDLGGRSAAFANETAPNGGRLNVGRYGNTADASRSPTNRTLLALTYNAGGIASGTNVRVAWVAGNAQPSDTVRLEYSLNGGATWSIIATNQPATNEVATWNTTVHPSSGAAKWRVIYEAFPAIAATNSGFFSVRNTNLAFYVNDAATAGDVYTTNPGASTNIATTSAPSDSLINLLASHTVSGGDVIYVDTGMFNVTNTINMTYRMRGGAGNPLLIVGSTNYNAGGTVFSRNSSTSDVFSLNSIADVTFRSLAVQNGRYGFNLTGSPGITFDRVTFRDNTYAIQLASSSSNAVIRNSLMLNNGVGTVVLSSPRLRVENTTMYGLRGVLLQSSGSLAFSNNIVRVSGSSAAVFEQINGSFSEPPDNNLYWPEAGAALAKFGASTFTLMTDYQKFFNQDWSSTLMNPQFASTNDFHLRSQNGRWDGTNFVNDAETSPAIDLGNPASSFANETAPNGGRVNAGAYGNTSEASRSPTNARLLALTYTDGGALSVPGDRVYWNYVNFPTNATVRIEYSANSGLSWSTVATNLAVTNGFYTWSNTNTPSSRFALWRVVYEANTNVVGATTNIFTLRNGVYRYYVNDASTAGDVYCTGLGDNSHPGLTPDLPKATIDSVLSAYTLGAGDIIYVDTGVYQYNTTITITPAQSGTNGNPVLIQGSTNLLAGGTVLRGPSSPPNAPALTLGSGLQDVTIRDLILQRRTHGISIGATTRITLERVHAESNSLSGIFINGASDTVLRNVVIRQNTQDGINVSGGSNLVVQHSVLWMNGQAGINTANTRVMVTNSVLGARATGALLYSAPSVTNIVGNYNNLYVEQDASVGQVNTINRTLNSLAAWQAETGQERFSLDADPQFVNPDGRDFHLRSQTVQGRYDPLLGWVTDTITSPLIDAGDPGWSFSQEPTPNGSRVNIGLYGNTPEASRADFGRLWVGNLRQGGWVRGTSTLHWVSAGLATNALVRVEVSPNGGDSWTVLSTGTLASSEQLAWNTLATNDTPAGLWRVTAVDNPSISNQSTNFFAVRNAVLTYFVNDGSTVGDQFTTAVGSPANWRASSNQPLDSVATIFDRYDLEPGDRILVDRGTYNLGSGINVGFRDSGSSTTLVTLAGATSCGLGASALPEFVGLGSITSTGFRFTSARDVVLSNLVIRQAGAALRVSRSTRLQFDGVRAWNSVSNAADVVLSTNILFRRTLLAHSGYNGLFSVTNQQVQFYNSMLWSNAGGGILQYSGDLSITNSVLQTAGSGRSLLTVDYGGLVRSDFNNLLNENASDVARYNGRLFKFPASWQEATTNDLRSLSHPPAFVDFTNGNFRLRSAAGRWDAATCGIVTDTVTSVMLDSGDPLFAYDQEPAPNGSRINLGIYGNSAEASRSPTNARLLVLSLNTGGTIRGTNVLYWSANAAAAGHLVYVDVSLDGGATWTNIATNVSASAGSVPWDASSLLSSPAGRWRITSQNEPAVASTNQVAFTLSNGSIAYYVNDASTVGDVYALAPGSSLNDGLSAGSPLLSIKDIFDRYVPAPGDFILVDTGNYFVTNTLTLDANFSGTSTNPVTIQGSTNWAVGGSRFDLNRQGPLITLNGVTNITIRDLVITNARRGVTMQLSRNIQLDRLHIRGLQNLLDVGVPPIAGIVVESSENITINRVIVQNVTNRSSSAGILLSALSAPNPQSNSVQVLNSILWSNAFGIRSLVATRLAVSNTVIQSYGANSVGLDMGAGSVVSANYNNYRMEQGAIPVQLGVVISPTPAPTLSASIQYPNLAAWIRASGMDTNTLSHDPGFADPENMNFGLLSTGGRDTGAGVVNDATTSVLVDGGPLSFTFTNEPAPNGGRVNLGPDGNTARASLSPTNRGVVLLSYNDGGMASGTNVVLRWDLRGTYGAQTFRIWLSANDGQSWSTLSNGVPATQRWYVLNSTLQPSGYGYRWRVTDDLEPSVAAASEVSFVIRNTNFSFYVNDGSPTGDVYTTATGGSLASGLTPSAPRDSLRSILDSYDLEPGDTVYVDTGLYTLTGNLTIGQGDTGDGSNVVNIIGSTNAVAGGTEFRGGGFWLQSPRGLSLQHLTVRSGPAFVDRALYVESGTNVQVRWFRALAGGYGVYIKESADVNFRHCLVMNALTNGVELDKARKVAFNHSVLLSNSTFAFSTILDLSVSNSILGASGSGRYVYGGFSNELFAANYNAYVLESGGRLGRIQFGAPPEPFPRQYNTLAKWIAEYGRDVNSIVANPLFAAPGQLDFHLQSETGRWEPGLTNWVLDGQTSPLIDAGDPGAVATNEPAPNGNRVNIGLYGSTTTASKSPVVPGFVVASLTDGGSVAGTNIVLYWIARGPATGHTVRVEFSGNDGLSWAVLASNLAAGTSSIAWDSTTVPSTILARWRVVSEVNTNIAAQTLQTFAVRNGPIPFYLNDGSLSGDVYTSVTGSDSQNGANPAAPMRSLFTLLDRYDLEPGDVVYMDTGVYTNTASITIDQLDAGFRLIGSTNSMAGGTTLVFTNVTEGIRIFQAGFTELSQLRMRGADTFVYVLDTPDAILKGLQIQGGSLAISALRSPRLTLRNSSIRLAATGLQISQSASALIENNVFWSNTTAAISLSESDATVYNNVFGVFGLPERYAFILNRGVFSALDYNVYDLRQGGLLAREPVEGTVYFKKWDRVSMWSRDTGLDLHSFSVDPAFADANNGDFRLRSKAGRYNPASGLWVNDTNTSALVDAGNPLTSLSLETAPNGGRVDIGMYGNTPEASRTPTNAVLQVARLNDGGRAEGFQVPLSWIAYGAATGHTVRLEYSSDGGSNWFNIQNNLPATAELVYWDSQSLAGWRGAWRVVSENDTSVWSRTARDFQLRNAPLALYVNDDFLSGDVYTTALGLPENTGLSPSSPRRSIQSIVDDYDLEPGDTVYVDTGEYILSSPVTIGRFDGWDDLNNLSGLSGEGISARIKGSTNELAGGSRIIAFNGIAGFELNDVFGFNLSGLNISHFPYNVGTSVDVEDSPYTLLDWLRVRDGDTGVSVHGSEYSRLWHLVVNNFNNVGVNVRESADVTLRQSIFWSNQVAMSASAGGDVIARNNVVGALRSGSVGWQRNNDALPTEYGLLDSEYNLFWSVDSAFVAELTGRQYPGQRRRFQRLINWQRDSGEDLYSTHANPRFANVALGDFHPQSPFGRYVSGSGYTTNGADAYSPLLDLGDPALPFGLETSPNGQRIDIGLYGNAPESSLSSTNGRLRVLTLNDGGAASGLIELRWSASGVAMNHPVTLQYSSNGGTTWTNIATNVLASLQYYLWDSEPYGRAAAGVWRITSQINTGLTSRTENFFALRQGGTIPYYVNDGNLGGDVYTTAVGNDANDGFLPSTPKATLQALVDAVDLEPGDVVYVDTGNYAYNIDTLIGELDSGVSTNPVIFRGSTNLAFGGTVLDRITGQGAPLMVDKAEGLDFRNMVFRNGQYGVLLELCKSITVRNSQMVNNLDDGIRIAGSTETRVLNNLLWNNGINGIHVVLLQKGALFSTGSVSAINNTIWGNPNGIRLGLGGAGEAYNNLIQANGPGSRIIYMAEGVTNILSDYNAFYRQAGALVAERDSNFGGNTFFGRLQDWQAERGNDLHTLTHDPLLADALTGDFHPKSATGRFLNNGSVVTDAPGIFSPLLDTGNPASIWTNESSPNGQRINIGHYGNHIQASRSRTNGWLLALTLNDGGRLAGPSNRVYWAAGGWPTTATVRVELANDGVDFQVIASNVNVYAGSINLDVSARPVTSLAKWRVVSEADETVIDPIESPFVIKNTCLTIYVNDGSTWGDVFCAVSGSSTNSGLSTNAPMSDPEMALSMFPLGPCDVVYIDTGVYYITNTLGVQLGLIGDDLKSGSVSEPIRIVGSTNLAAGGALLVATPGAENAMRIINTEYVQLQHLRFTGGATNGLQLKGSENIRVLDCDAYDNKIGFSSEDGLGSDFSRCAAWSNTQWGLSAKGQYSEVVWRNGVLAGNGQGAIQHLYGPLTVSNSILVAASNSLLYSINSSFAASRGDYNLYWPTTNNTILMRDTFTSVNYPSVRSWQIARGMDSNSFVSDPLFADPATGDFHLQSRRGRYDPVFGTFVTDTQTSWAIDAGPPGDAFNQETSPNGGRVNIGRHANTAQASRSDTNRELFVVSLRDGGTAASPQPLVWLARGFTTTDTVRIEYTVNDGLGWLVLASNLPATQLTYVWDNATIDSTPLARWRVILESNPLISDVTPSVFTVRNGPILYYVNDGSTVGDIYTVAAGLPLNNGITVSTALDSVSTVLDRYDLDGGDVVFVDTGIYNISNDIMVLADDSGLATNYVRIQGSLNQLTGGSLFYRMSTNALGGRTNEAAFQMIRAAYVELADVTIENANIGVFINNKEPASSDRTRLNRVTIRNGGKNGIYAQYSNSNIFERVVVRNNLGKGIELQTCQGISLLSSVVWSNGSDAVSVTMGVLNMSNSVLHVHGPVTNAALELTDALTRSDYNNFYVQGSASYALLNDEPVGGLPQYTQRRTQDVHSVAVDPLYPDPDAENFYPRSQNGRYDPVIDSFVTSDTNTSWLIDVGNPAFSFANEPSPNGYRRNVGLEGDTSRASKSRTNEWLLAVTAMSGGRIGGVFPLHWFYGNLDDTNRVDVHYSVDGGTNWMLIVANVPINQDGYLWNSLNADPFQSPTTKWRVRVVGATNLVDETDTIFGLNGPFRFYVNDTNSLAGDVFTTALGNDSNLGISSNAPKATLRALMDYWDVDPEDLVLIDTGTYQFRSNDVVVVRLDDQGVAGEPVTILGSTNGVVWDALSITVPGPGGVGVGPYVLNIEAPYVVVDNISLFSAGIQSTATNVEMRNISVERSNVELVGPHSLLENFRLTNGVVSLIGSNNTVRYGYARNSRAQLVGNGGLLQNAVFIGSNTPLLTVGGRNVEVVNNTLVSERTAITQIGTDSLVRVRNNIIVANGSGGTAFCIEKQGGVTESDYNLFQPRNGAWFGNAAGGYWERLIYWQQKSGQDSNSLAVNPLFADEAFGDFHLRSTSGRWSNGVWVIDVTNSPAIDAGDPSSLYGSEPSPNGARINIGAYGNTAEASKSRTNAWLQALSFNDGGVARGTNTLRWLAGAVDPTNRVTLQYSSNGGASWQDLGTNIQVGDGAYEWNTLLSSNSLDAMWRVVLESNTNVYDQTDSMFNVRNDVRAFYVNDSSLSGDVFSTAVGNSGNDGRTPGTPKNSLLDLLATYDTEPQDTVYVDTGTYVSPTLQIIWSRGGDSNAHVTIQGSTNPVAGGTVLRHPNRTADGIILNASYMTLRDLIIENASRGIFVETSSWNRLERLGLRSNNVGVLIKGGQSNQLSSSWVWRSTEGGVDIDASPSVAIENITYVNNLPFSLRMNGSLGSVAQNSIFYHDIASSNSQYAIDGASNTVLNTFIDYNVYYFGPNSVYVSGTNTVTNTYIYGTFNDLLTWQRLRYKDFRSAVTNPLFNNVNVGDFHLQSQAGRYNLGTGTFITDTQTSWAIDYGNPYSAFTNEPSPNGGRVNIGAYGNTPYASKGTTNPLAYARTANNSIFVTAALSSNGFPLIWHMLNVPFNFNVSVQYSGDGGTEWTTVQSGVPAYTEYVIWTNSPIFNSFNARWRVIGEGVGYTNYTDINDGQIRTFFGVHRISSITPDNGKFRIIWRGAWDENYQVQYATNTLYPILWTNLPVTNALNWINSGPITNLTLGGDTSYTDPDSTSQQVYRVYRVLWLGTNGIPYQ